MKAAKKEEKRIDFSAMSRSELEEFAMQKSTEVFTLEAKLQAYEEQIRKNRSFRFGAKAERYECDGQISFFNETEAETKPDIKEPEPSDVFPPRRKKQKGHKKNIIKNIPKEVIEYTLSDNELECPKCGEQLSEMKTVARAEIHVTRPKHKVVEHRTHVYACENCDKNGTEGTIISADSPNGLFRNSLASSSMVADILFKKYNLAQPLYRQQKELERIGLKIGRNTLANWVILAERDYLSHIISHMHKSLLNLNTIYADETPVEVLSEPGRKATTDSYMWMYRSGRFEKEQIILFDYTPGRGAVYPQAFLGGYQGYIHCDGYSAYRVVARESGTDPPDIILSSCFAHARRYFTDIVKSLKKNETIKGTATETALMYIGALFKIEEKIKDMSAKERFEYRNEHAVSIVDEYFAWCRSVVDDCTGSLHKAVNYSLNQETGLRNYLLDGRLDISNNLGENAIRPFCVGRRNWLFCDTPNGAKASAAIYGIIETAKANEIDPFEYFKYIFEIFKDADISSLDMDEFMPWSQSLPDHCKAKDNSDDLAS